MDEVWKDLSLTSFLHPPTTTTATATRPPLYGLVLQEFLPLSQKKDGDHQVRIISEPDTGAKTPPFSFNSATDHCCPCPDVNLKRGTAIDENFGEKKRTRLMKNRESAVRSRARKQAYTYELESEVAHLLEENAKLRKQVEELQLCKVAPDDDHPEKKKLHRTLSSPF